MYLENYCMESHGKMQIADSHTWKNFLTKVTENPVEEMKQAKNIHFERVA